MRVKNEDVEAKKLKVPYSPFGSEYGFEELEAIAKAWQDEHLTMGPLVREFEAKFAEYTGTKYAVATTSCTTALYIITQAIGLRPGDEVITTPLTFIATSFPPFIFSARCMSAIFNHI